MLMKDGDLATEALYLKKRVSKGPELVVPSSFNYCHTKITHKEKCNTVKTVLKAPYFSKNRHFIIQESFKKY